MWLRCLLGVARGDTGAELRDAKEVHVLGRLAVRQGHAKDKVFVHPQFVVVFPTAETGVCVCVSVWPPSSFFSGICSKPVRDKFSRLMQIASLLQVDKVEEIFDYWTSDTQVWRLSPREVKEVLMLRIEFSKNSVMQLKL